MPKLIRVTTVPIALKYLLAGQMKYMKEHGFDVIMVSADDKEREDVIRNEGCPHHVIPMTRKITPFSDLKSLWKMYRFFKKEKPDIVHSHTPKAGLIAMLAAKMAGVKTRVHTIAGLRFMTAGGMTRRILVWMEKLTAGAATHVWPNSRSLMEYIRQHKLVKPRKLEVIGEGSSNGINLDRFSVSSIDPAELEEVKKLIHFDPSLTYLVSVGRIVQDKGIDELLSAFTRLYDQNNSLRLILVGSFEDELDPVSDQARQILKTHPALIQTGWRDDVEYFMHLSQILVHASYREGFPNVLLQAGAMGCPVCCSRIEGNVDVVEHEKTGLIFKVKDAESLYITLQRALSGKPFMQTMSVQLRKRIESCFDQKVVHASLLAKYQAITAV